MGQYKVPQNVEAEDKILGSLTMKQFIYALIGVGYGFLTFAIFREVPVFFIIFGLPPALLFMAVGLYQRQDQPFETYLVGVLSFWSRPKQRFWEKEPIAEVFRVDPPPPKPEEIMRNPREVRGQLSRLAGIVDTRGWSAKDPGLQVADEVPVVNLLDRLGGAPELPPLPEAAATEVTAADDILDTTTPDAAALNELIENTVKDIREEALEKMQKQVGKPPAKPKPAPKVVAPVAAEVSAPKNETDLPTDGSTSDMTPAPSGDILNLTSEGGDLSVAQLAAQAQRQQNQLTEGQAVNLRPT